MKNIAIDCVLFEKCNLNCSHCFQTHENNEIDGEYIKNLFPLVYKTLKEEVSRKNPDLIMFSMRGGELFQDCIDDSLIEEYKNLILKIKSSFKEDYKDKTITIHIMSNGVYNNIDRVINLLKEVDGKITLSFDAFGRYNNESQKELFYKNYKILKSYDLIKNIAITLTKESIQEYINNVSLLRQFDDSEIDFNYYIPTTRRSSLPSDDELYEFFKFLLDNKFYNCIYLRNILEHHRTNNPIYPSCNCANTTVIYNNKIYKTCNIYIPRFKLTDFYDDENVTDDNAMKLIINKGINKRKCLLCPYYGKCSYYCWMMLCYKDYIMNDCPHKRIHEYIENSDEVKEEFLKWCQ